jgi:hypothetical protein
LISTPIVFKGLGLGKCFSNLPDTSTRSEGVQAIHRVIYSLLFSTLSPAESKPSRARVTSAVFASAIQSETLLASNSKERSL